MDLINPKKLEDYVLKLLMAGEQPTTALLSLIRKETGSVTKQGFYASLRKLKKDEVIVIYKGVVSLNTTWIEKMRNVIETVGKIYTTDQKSFGALDLEDKESLSYSFSSIKNLDAFWGHAQNILMHNTSDNEPIYSYDPHYWAYIARKEIEDGILKSMVEHKRQFLMTVGNSTKLDKSVASGFNNKFLQYNYKKMFDKGNYYITVIGDYVIEVSLDEGISKKIHHLYEIAIVINEDTVKNLKTLLDAKARNKIKISKNKTKAEKLKKKLRKDFYFVKK